MDPRIVSIRYHPPYDWGAMLAFFAARAIPGVESVSGQEYRRTVAHDGGTGWLAVTHAPERGCLVATIHLPAPGDLHRLAARMGFVFDCNTETDPIGRHLARDPGLAPLVARRPGLRVPGGWSGFELAARAVLGQQVTLAATRTLAGRLAALCGTPVRAGEAGLAFAFPTPAQVWDADLDRLGLPRARRSTLRALAEAAGRDRQLLVPAGGLAPAVARLRAIPGIGEWTAQYIALRALREADAFPASDIGLLRGAARLYGARPSPARLLDRAEAWRPWRAYAAQHLWSADAQKDDADG